MIKCLLGLVRPDEGVLSAGGLRVDNDVVYREQIGYMPQQAAFPENLSGRDVIALIRSVRRSDLPVDWTLLRTLELEAELDKPIRTMSGGTRQKLSAVLAFMFSPPILVLDEPTAGLDPVASAALKDHVRRAADNGTTVLLTSHVMADLEELSNRIVFLLDGRVRFDGTLDAIREETGEERLERAIARILRRAAA
jgi:Cu-processing system ATP-binding protein